MKIHLQKTKVQGTQVHKYNLPECGKRGKSNYQLYIVSSPAFEAMIDSKHICTDCKAVYKQKYGGS